MMEDPNSRLATPTISIPSTEVANHNATVLNTESYNKIGRVTTEINKDDPLSFAAN